MSTPTAAMILTNWRIVTENGYLYCYGKLHGRAWETSYVTSIYTSENYYVLYTTNSIYYLYFEDSKK